MKEKKTEIGDKLRKVDTLIKSGSLSEALTLITEVIEADQSNFYARAYQERITDLLAEQHKKKPATSPPPASASKRNDSPDMEIVSPKLFIAGVEAYERFLHEIWKDGTVTSSEQKKLREMKESLNISDDDHDYLEQKIRVQHFLHSIKMEFVTGDKNIDALYARYKITGDEQYILETKVKQIIDSSKSVATVLTLDDDENFLLLLQRMLVKKGYSCFTTGTAEEAMELLEEVWPDIVLCDIAFGNDRMNGFMFYEKFRAIKAFLPIPFVFISGINQGKMIETARRLGADDYLMKPVEPTMLMATIEGKLKRFQEFRHG